MALGRDGMSLHSGDTGVQEGMLSIKPTNVTLAVTNVAPMPTQTFTASLTLSGATHDVSATWSLSNYTIGSISSAGTFTAAGTAAGTVTVTAQYGMLTATTKVTVTVKTSSNLTDVTLPDGTVISEDSTAITPADLTALNGPLTMSDSGAATTLLYPYDQTVFPLGLLAPVVQFSAGAVAPVDFKISLDATGFHWDGFGHVGNPAALQAAIPQNVWDGVLDTATLLSPPAVTVSIVKAAGGVAYGPAAQSRLVIANGKLTGVIYYESYSSDAIDGGTDFGLWAVKPGLTTPPAHLEPGCVICHSVAAAGNTLTTGSDDGPAVCGSTGVFRVEPDGGYTHLATPPTALPCIGGSAGPQDVRGMGWSTVSPDGKVIMRSLGDFWGGQQILAWATPSQPLLLDGGLQPLSTSMTLNGAFDMFVPQYSVDGKHIVYVTAANAVGVGSPGAPSQSIGMLDVSSALTDAGPGAGDGGYGAVTFSNPRLLYDSTTAAADAGASAYTKVPTFLPDSESIVFEETRMGVLPEYNYMLPDDGPVDGELAMLQKTSGGSYVRVALKNANAGNDPSAPTVNYEPKPLPVAVGGYYWVVFASLRTDAYPTVASPKKLWVTAISEGATPGTDASHPPFTLVNQAIVSAQQSQRAFWALAPCQGMGASCQTGTDCCNGSCIPSSPQNPSSPLECLPPTMSACVPLGGRCAAGQNQDCCNESTGITCVGTLNGYGTCSAPAPPP
jgi:hypothetical protein